MMQKRGFAFTLLLMSAVAQASSRIEITVSPELEERARQLLQVGDVLQSRFVSNRDRSAEQAHYAVAQELVRKSVNESLSFLELYLANTKTGETVKLQELVAEPLRKLQVDLEAEFKARQPERLADYQNFVSSNKALIEDPVYAKAAQSALTRVSADFIAPLALSGGKDVAVQKRVVDELEAAVKADFAEIRSEIIQSNASPAAFVKWTLFYETYSKLSSQLSNILSDALLEHKLIVMDRYSLSDMRLAISQVQGFTQPNSNAYIAALVEAYKARKSAATPDGAPGAEGPDAVRPDPSDANPVTDKDGYQKLLFKGSAGFPVDWYLNQEVYL